MLKKIKNIISKTDHFFYKKFGSDKSTKSLENIKEAQIIFSLINEAGKESDIRFVGGCVRRAICGEKIDDIDLATSLKPDVLKKKIFKENIKIIDTGISHGTITVILNKKKFEITTLRKDVVTDGRHATVEFSSNWKQDALRRDFTINAIYADIFGRIFDPENGVADLRMGIVKFIGNSEERIQEDYLRILRYFRFFTQYSKIDHEHETIKSIKRNINGLNKISKERIFDELKKIIKLKNVYKLFYNNVSKDVILNIFPQFKYYERLKKAEEIYEKFKIKYDNILILSLLILDKSNDYEYFCHKYKLPNETKDRFKNISLYFEKIKNKNFYNKKNIKKLIYYNGKDSVKDLLLFSLCANTEINNLDIQNMLIYLESCKVPKFPISGDYLKNYGYETGETLGRKLKSIEELWIENDFIIKKEMLDKTLNKSRKI